MYEELHSEQDAKDAIKDTIVQFMKKRLVPHEKGSKVVAEPASNTAICRHNTAICRQPVTLPFFRPGEFNRQITHQW